MASRASSFTITNSSPAGHVVAGHPRDLRISYRRGVTVSRTWIHIQPLVPTLPFGGLAESGIRSHYGQDSFDTLSHAKSDHVKSTRMNPSMLYPPFSNATLKIMRVLS